MNKNNKKNFFVWIIFSLLQVLSAAEDKNFSIVPVLHNDEIALRFVACHYLNDHDAISSFAETNKAYNNYMLGSANTRKKLLSTCINGVQLGSTRHKYGGIYCQAYIQEKLNDLVLTYSILKNGKSSGRSHHFSCFTLPLPYKQSPFFNDKNELSFYGYGKMGVNDTTETVQLEQKTMSTIIRYTGLKNHFEDELLRCVMAKKGDEVGGKQMYRRFDFCMEYPFLLKAILNSSLVTRNDDNQELIFWLDGVTLPDNYAEKISIQELSDNWAFNSYEHLPDIIKSFIEKT
jgi:hypothetical protein